MTYADAFRRAYAASLALSPQSQASGPSPADIARAAIRTSKSNLYGGPVKPKQEGEEESGKFDKPWLYAISPVVGIAADLMSGDDLSPANRVIDLLSRGNYASANATLEGNKILDKPGAPDISDFLSAMGKGAIEGATGRAKTTFSDVIEQHDPDASDFRKGAVGFLGDVFADPTTYIPVAGAAKLLGQLGRQGAETVAKSAPKAYDASKLIKVDKNTYKVPAPDEGYPTVDLEALLKKSGNSETSGFMAGTRGLPAAPIKPAFTVSSEGLIKIAPDSPFASQTAKFTDRFMPNGKVARVPYDKAADEVFREGWEGLVPAELLALRGSVDALKKASYSVPIRRYGSDVNVSPLYSEVVEQVPRQVTETVESKPQWASVDEALAAVEANPQHTFTLGKTKVKVEDLLKMVQSVERSARNGSYTPEAAIKKAILAKTMLKKEAERLFNGQKVAKPQTVTKTVMEEARSVKRGDFKQWAAQHADILDREDIIYIGKASNQKAFETRLKNTLARKTPGNFESWGSLMEAVEKGLVDEADLKPLLELTGAKSAKGLTRKAQALVNKLSKAEQAALRDNSVKKSQRYKAGAIPATEFETPAVADVARVAEAEEIVPKADDFVSAVENGNAAVFERPVPTLSETQLRELNSIADQVDIKNLVDPQDINKYPFLTNKTKARKTGPSLGKGYANHVGGYNAFTQSDAFRVVGPVSKRLRTQFPELKGNALSARLYDETMPMFDALALSARKAGFEPVAGAAKNGYPISMYEVLNALPRPVVEKFLFNYSTSVFPSEVMKAADAVLKEYLGKVPAGNARRIIDASLNSPTSQKKVLSPLFNSKYKNKNPQALVDEFANAMVDAMPAIAAAYEKNLARIGLKQGAQVGPATKEAINQAVEAIGSPRISMGDAEAVIRNTKATARKAAKEKGATEAVANIAADLADAELGKILSPADRQYINYDYKLQQLPVGAPREAVNEITREQAAVAIRETEEALGPHYDFSQSVQAAFSTELGRRFWPIINKFNAHYGQNLLRHTELAVNGSLTTEAHLYRRNMASLHDYVNKTYGLDGKELLVNAFRNLQSGTRIPDETPLADVTARLEPALNTAFDGLERNGVPLWHFNDNLHHFGVPDQYLYDPKGPVDQWRQWAEVTNPLDLLDRVNAAKAKSLVEVTVGADFSARFGVKSAKPGYVRIQDSRGKSLMVNFIDTKLWYPREVAHQLHVMDSVMMHETKLSKFKRGDSDLKKWINYYDGAVQAYKTGLTIYRPGHHFRNFVGDASLSFLAGLNNPRYYSRAQQVLATRNNYAGWDGLAALREAPTSAGDAVKIKVNGKDVGLDKDSLYRAGHQKGLLLDYSTLEDTAYTDAAGTNNIFSKIREKSPLKGKAHNVAAGVSQYNSHLTRMAHFMHELEHGNYRSLEDALTKASDKVRKWHPDGSDLTKFEHDYMRRGFMFYSWVRKAIPLVMEATLMKPGKVIMFPKAQYNFAVSMGIDPESLSNPFPDDQLFPDFLTDMVSGPQMEIGGKYYGSEPGFASNDVLNQFFQNDGWRGFAGSLTPLARVPIELATGTNLGIGTSITDKSDYLDSQLPGVNYVANMTNRSITGLGAPQANNIEYVGNRRTVVDNPGTDDLAILNFLSGLGIKNMSKPNYIKRAQNEEKYGG